jgi:signal transduction histidine kinase
MMKLALRLWNRLFFLGIKPSQPAGLKNDIYTSNEASIMVWLYTLPVPLINYLLMPSQRHWLVLLGLGLANLGGLLCNGLGWYLLGRLWVFLVGYLFVFWSSSVFGYASDIHYVLIVILFAVTLNYKAELKPFSVLMYALPFATALALYFTGFQLWAEPAVTPAMQQQISLVVLAVCMMCSFSLTLNYVRRHHQTTQHLKEIALNLQNQNHELNKVNQELDRFVYSVSHDLRAPIASVLGLVRLSRLETNPELLRTYFDMQEKSLQTLDYFIRNVLDFSRNSRAERHIEPLDLTSLINEVVELQFLTGVEQKPRPEVEVVQTVDFYGDRQRLAIVLNNLVSNAIRFADPTKPTSQVRIQAQACNGTAHFKIIDNGIGISPEHLPRVFDMFYRATEQKTGSGLGLYIVKETVKTMGGEIFVTSEPGQGTHFSLDLPNLKALAH